MKLKVVEVLTHRGIYEPQKEKLILQTTNIDLHVMNPTF